MYLTTLMKKESAVVENHSMFDISSTHIPNKSQKCGFVTIVGYPNSGKSTLINYLIGYKVSIVTHKVQTTRRQIQGILTEGDSQIVFIDTPGIFEPKKTLEKAIVETAYRSFHGVDMVLLIMDPRQYNKEFIEKIKNMTKEKLFCLVLNKIDCVDKSVWQDLPGFKISAKTGEGVDELKKYILSHLPQHPFMYDADQLTNINQKIWTSEITREKTMLFLQQELPYELYIETEQFKETSSKIDIHQVIVVSRDSLKGMVLGSGGQMVKKIGTEARLEMEKYFEKKVNLFLYVKVQKQWQEKKMVLQSLGIL